MFKDLFKKGSDANKQAGQTAGKLAQQWLGPNPQPDAPPVIVEEPEFPIGLLVGGVLLIGLVVALKK